MTQAPNNSFAQPSTSLACWSWLSIHQVWMQHLNGNHPDTYQERHPNFLFPKTHVVCRMESLVGSQKLIAFQRVEFCLQLLIQTEVAMDSFSFQAWSQISSSFHYGGKEMYNTIWMCSASQARVLPSSVSLAIRETRVTWRRKGQKWIRLYDKDHMAPVQGSAAIQGKLENFSGIKAASQQWPRKDLSKKPNGLKMDWNQFLKEVWP